MSLTLRRSLAAALLVLALPSAALALGPDPALRSKLLAAFANLKSYRLTVLGSVRSAGVWVTPNRYQMTTEFEGKPVKTIIIGNDYWTFSNGKWEKQGTTSGGLEVDIAGLLRDAKLEPSIPFVHLADVTQDGKRVGTFQYNFKNGTQETCNFDPATYRVTRCKADELTLLYSGFNDPANRVDNPK